MPWLPALAASRHPRTLALVAVALLTSVGGCAQRGANRDAIVRCTPGDRIDVSCGCAGLGEECDGRAGIRLCDPALARGECTEAQAVTITTNNDVCLDETSCPHATTYCPSSGMIAVHTFARPNYDDTTAPYTCRWQLRATPVFAGPNVTFACEPGELVRASCGCGVGRRCEGDPVMRACAVGAACTDASTRLDYNDDTCGNCPEVEATCPADGRIVIATEPLSGGSRFRCDVGALGERSGALRPAGGV